MSVFRIIIIISNARGEGYFYLVVQDFVLFEHLAKEVISEVRPKTEYSLALCAVTADSRVRVNLVCRGHFV